MSHYGQIETWNPETKEGSIFCIDYKTPLHFTSNRQWRIGDCVTFRPAVVAVSVEPAGASPLEVIDVTNDGAQNVGYRDARTNEVVPFYESPEQFTQLGDKEAAEGQRPRVVDCGTVDETPTDDVKSTFRPWSD